MHNTSPEISDTLLLALLAGESCSLKMKPSRKVKFLAFQTKWGLQFSTYIFTASNPKLNALLKIYIYILNISSNIAHILGDYSKYASLAPN